MLAEHLADRPPIGFCNEFLIGGKYDGLAHRFKFSKAKHRRLFFLRFSFVFAFFGYVVGDVDA
jgi:hypothetical protein